MNKFDTLYNQILSEEKKRIRTINVVDESGKTVKTYAPNHIGSTEQKLLDKAEKMAEEVKGKVHITYY